jgi:glyoxylase-like metal-dependent hydrolase (beta-lactamase superfamily II)
MVDFVAGTAGPGNLDVAWHAGWQSAKHDPAPEIQVHWYDEHTAILRQNKSVHYEAPFLFLLFGNEQALLLDTGATAEPEYFPLRRTVDDLLVGWLASHQRPGYRLTVAHTHPHGDHVAGDPQFADRPDTTVVGPRLPDVVAFYGLTDWPAGHSTVDLGGRVLDVLPGPGHHAAATVFYDRYTGILFTGDSICRGRLYVFDWAAYAATIDRLIDFCRDRPVSHVLGGHIEMTTTPGKDYPIGCTYQPAEAPLQLTVDHLHSVRDALTEIGDLPPPTRGPAIHPYDDFIVYRIPAPDGT